MQKHSWFQILVSTLTAATWQQIASLKWIQNIDPFRLSIPIMRWYRHTFGETESTMQCDFNICARFWAKCQGFVENTPKHSTVAWSFSIFFWHKQISDARGCTGQLDNPHLACNETHGEVITSKVHPFAHMTPKLIVNLPQRSKRVVPNPSFSVCGLQNLPPWCRCNNGWSGHQWRAGCFSCYSCVIFCGGKIGLARNSMESPSCILFLSVVKRREIRMGR